MIKCCLTIAGSDSGGNAGVQADLRAFHAYGLHGCTVFTALTAQNPDCVNAILPVDAAFVAAQLDAVLGTYSIGALKTGMLGDVAAIEAIATRFAAHPEICKVIDPVMIATSGGKLAGEKSVDALISCLFPFATLITPNIPEAEVLMRKSRIKFADRRENGENYAIDLAKACYGQYGKAVLVKGGHSLADDAVDILCDGHGEISRFVLPRIPNPVSTHGTGCSLAAALAAELCLGSSLRDAVAGAKRFVHDAIASSYYVGANCGVLGFAPRKKGFCNG